MVAQNNAATADFATRTSVALLDALIDSMVLARPGTDADKFAADIKRLGDGAAHAAVELCALLDMVPAEADDPVIAVPLPERHARVA